MLVGAVQVSLHSCGLAWRLDRDEEGCGKINVSTIAYLYFIQLGMAPWELHRVVKGRLARFPRDIGLV